MSVAVAHQITTTSRVALREAAREAVFRETDLAVIHVAESLDEDVTDAFQAGVSDEIERALGSTDLGDLQWKLHLAPGGPDVARIVLQMAKTVGAEVLVIGGRRRTPVGKALLGSVAQRIILGAPCPVLVVMPDA